MVPEDTRALLRAYRQSLEPEVGAKGRCREGLEARLKVRVETTARRSRVRTFGRSQGRGRTSNLAIAASVGVAAAVVLVVVGLMAMRRQWSDVNEVAVRAQANYREDEHRPNTGTPLRSPRARPRPERTANVVTSKKRESTGAEPFTHAQRAKAARDPRPQPREVSIDSLREEVELMERARAALDAGRLQSAETLLRAHALRFPEGALAQERIVWLLVSECRMGRLGAGRRAAAFLSRERPEHAALVRAECRDAISSTESAASTEE